MIKYHDIKLLAKMRTWILDPNRKSANQFSKEIGYSDFNKIAAYLVEIAKKSAEEFPAAIDEAADLVEQRQMKISKGCFKTIAKFVFSIEPHHIPSFRKLESSRLNEELWIRLGQMKASPTGQPELFKLKLEEIKDFFIRSREELDRANLESVILAGVVVFLVARTKEQVSAEDNLTKMVCVPMLASLGLPDSESSVSRYRTGSEALVVELQPYQEPQPAFSHAWWDWWLNIQNQIQQLCKEGPDAFARITSTRELPGAKKFLPKPETGNSQENSRRDSTLESKLQQREKRYQRQTETGKKKAINQAVERAWLELAFLARADEEKGLGLNAAQMAEALDQIRSTRLKLISGMHPYG